MTEQIRIFINESPATVAAHGTILDAVAAVDSDAARDLRDGRAYVTDGVGRPLELGGGLAAGAILRVVRSSRPSRTPEPKP